MIGKVEVFLHHKMADVENFGFIWAGQNTASPYATTGLYLTSGKYGYSTIFKGSIPVNCIVPSSALEDDNYYIMTSDFMTDNITMKANKVTIVNNAKVIGSDINGSTTAKGTETLTADIGVLSGRNNSAYVYSSKHKIFWVKFYDKSGNLMHEFNFSEGAGETTYDVVTGNAYPISNINPADFWNYKQDFNHYNFRYGFTLYQKSGSADIRIPNKKNGSEIILPAPPTGYTRIANYKECRQTFNNCENVFVLDDVSAGGTDLTVANAGDTILNGNYFVYDVYDGKNRYINNTIGTFTHFFNWFAGTWNWGSGDGSGGATVLFTSNEDVATPDLVTNWVVYGSGTEPAGTITVQVASPLKTADIDDVLFDASGVAKELTMQNIYSDVVDLVHDRGHLYINEDSDANFMLYKTDKGVDTPADLKIWAYVNK